MLVENCGKLQTSETSETSENLSRFQENCPSGRFFGGKASRRSALPVTLTEGHSGHGKPRLRIQGATVVGRWASVKNRAAVAMVTLSKPRMNAARRSRKQMNRRKRTQRTQSASNEKWFSLRSVRSFAAKEFALPIQAFSDSSTNECASQPEPPM